MRNSAFETLAGLPYFAAFFGVSLLLLTVCLALYVLITPYPEVKLIREGNAAAAASLGGAIIGFALPLASVVVTAYRCSTCCSGLPWLWSFSWRRSRAYAFWYRTSRGMCVRGKSRAAFCWVRWRSHLDC